LKLNEAVYSDFVAWSEDELFVLRILLAQNITMVHVIEEVKYGALPELLGKRYTKTNSHLLISKEIKPIEMFKLKTAALAVTSGVIVEDQRKDK